LRENLLQWQREVSGQIALVSAEQTIYYINIYYMKEVPNCFLATHEYSLVMAVVMIDALRSQDFKISRFMVELTTMVMIDALARRGPMV